MPLESQLISPLRCDTSNAYDFSYLNHEQHSSACVYRSEVACCKDAQLSDINSRIADGTNV
jgi:hypothetical protein